jgi:HEAT repeat protein
MDRGFVSLSFFLLLLVPSGSKEERVASDNWRAKSEESEWIGRSDESIPKLIRCLASTDVVAVRCALVDLSWRGEKAKPAVPRIKSLLTNPNPCVRIDAAWTLLDLRWDSEIAIRSILDAATTDNADVRAYIARVMGRIVDPPQEFGCWGPGPRPMTPRPQFGKVFAPILGSFLHDGDAGVRKEAIDALQRIGRDVRLVTREIKDAANDDDSYVRAVAESILKRIESDTEKPGEQ